MIGNVSDWLSYAGGALIKVADSAGSTVYLLGMWMDRVYSMPVVRNLSEVLCFTILAHRSDLEVKVMDFKLH